ncbi:release factor glutamine methyltransferase [Planctomycetales bacterium]|nr:release factor glutamine methyltransferase [Planctomycetales bacterium]
MPPEETWTVSRLLGWTADFFKNKGIEKPRLEAEILLAAAMKLKRVELYTNYDTEPDEQQRTLFRDFVKRRGSGEPVAYLVGFKEFYSIPFKVNRSVLIPRPETEDIVLHAVDVLKQSESKPPLLCDVGTGSGAIAVAVAKNVPGVHVIAIDISSEALTTAKSNAELNGVADRIKFRRSDLLNDVPEIFDIIVSNPPYVSQSEYDALPADVKNFEPKSALLAGQKGTEVIEQLIAQAAVKLKPGGSLFIEGSPMIADAVADLMSNWQNVQIIKDSAGHKRIIGGER